MENLDLKAFFKITYGLYAITTTHQEKMNGYIGNTVFQVTANPPQMAISCSKDNFSAHLIEASKKFAVSILEQDTSSKLIGTLGYQSGKDTNKFEKINYKLGQTGVPLILDNAIAWFECEVKQQLDVGSHLLFIGEIVNNELINPDLSPLTYAYYHEVKKAFAPKNAPTYIDVDKIQEASFTTEKGGKQVCVVCKYIYDPAKGDPDGGIPPGTPFEEIPDDWRCPVCGSSKDMFEPLI